MSWIGIVGACRRMAIRWSTAVWPSVSPGSVMRFITCTTRAREWVIASAIPCGRSAAMMLE
jgi:hypothetical protein